MIVTGIGASAWCDINHAKLSLPGSNPAAAREHEVFSRSRRKSRHRKQMRRRIERLQNSLLWP